jgi:uncharacterized protein YyaL (SSP411 family)
VVLDNADYTEKVGQMLLVMHSRIVRYPAAYTNWATLALSLQHENYLVAIVGEEAVSCIKKLKCKNFPGLLIFGSKHASKLPYFKGRYVIGKTLIYLCSSTYCLTPVESVEEAIILIENKLSN